jgi:hypothetical protein
MPTKPLLSAVLVLLSCSLGLQAQHSGHQDHSSGAEVLGQVTFPISGTQQVQQQFNRAVALLHSFEYDRSEQAFTNILKSDPNCAMAYWGIAMSLYHQLWAPPSQDELKRGWEAVEEARAVGARTERERAWIDAVATFYRDWDKVDHRTRAQAYERAMEQLYRAHPEDREAGVFYALALNATALVTFPMDKTYAKQKKAAEILNTVLRENPRHPGATHYLIHSYDYPALANLALPAARSYAKIAPSSAHALHMPSHIFTRLGLWRESIQSNLASGAAAREHAKSIGLDGSWDEELHAMDYLTYAYLQRGQDLEAEKMLEALRRINKVWPENFKCAYSFAAIPARVALERRRWFEAARLELHPAGFPWARFPYAEAIIHFARALGAARTGDTTSAANEVKALAELEKQAGKVQSNYDWKTQIEVQRRAAEACLSWAEHKEGKAVEMLRSAAALEDSSEKHPVTPGAVVPARELLAEVLLESGRYADSRREFETVLRDAPNRFRSLYGSARSAALSGDRSAARNYYARLLDICAQADGARPELAQARTFLGKKQSVE